MRTKILLGLAGMVAILVGAATFAAFESHMINVRAHVEKATFVEPDDIDLGTTLMQQSYSNQCAVDAPGVDGKYGTIDDVVIVTSGVNCLKIRLSASFLDVDGQTDFTTVDYKIFCEAKSAADQAAYHISHGITHYLELTDSDGGGDGDSIPGDANCVHADAPGSVGPAGYPTTAWATGSLVRGNDEYDLWDFDFYAPVCSGNYNDATDQSVDPPSPILKTIDQAYCHTGDDGHDWHPELGGNSDAFVNLGSNVKFQVNDFE